MLERRCRIIIESFMNNMIFESSSSLLLLDFIRMICNQWFIKINDLIAI